MTDFLQACPSKWQTIKKYSATSGTKHLFSWKCFWIYYNYNFSSYFSSLNIILALFYEDSVAPPHFNQTPTLSAIHFAEEATGRRACQAGWHFWAKIKAFLSNQLFGNVLNLFFPATTTDQFLMLNCAQCSLFDGQERQYLQRIYLQIFLCRKPVWDTNDHS